ncbi:unnamed protein product [Brassica rapa subsp. narinosa]
MSSSNNNNNVKPITSTVAPKEPNTSTSTNPPATNIHGLTREEQQAVDEWDKCVEGRPQRQKEKFRALAKPKNH